MEEKYSTYEVRRRAVAAVLDGHPINGVATIYGIHRSTLHRWLQRYWEGGTFESLVRKAGSGRPPILDAEALDQLVEMVLQPASDFGYETDFWTCRRLIQVTRKELGIRVSQPTMWRVLRDSGCVFHGSRPPSPRDPGRPVHAIPATHSTASRPPPGAKRRRDFILNPSSLIWSISSFSSIPP